jgi:hypothetical protein
MAKTPIVTKEIIEAHELDDLKQKHEARQKTIVDMANNFVAEQQIIANKPRLMRQHAQTESDFENAMTILSEKYGAGISINLDNGEITRI